MRGTERLLTTGFALLAAVGVAGGAAPTLTDLSLTVGTGRTSAVFMPLSDADSPLGTVRLLVQSGPDHGQVWTSGRVLYYMPQAGYLGPDSVSVRATDGTATSAVAACSLAVTNEPPAGTNLVLLVVKSTLLPEVTNEVARLEEDLEWDGYEARIVAWEPNDKTALWDYLRGEYTNAAQNLEGAILIGELPLATGSSGETTDLAYWNMTAFEVTTARHIWVCRIKGNVPGAHGSSYSSQWFDAVNRDREVPLTKRYLDINHAYRTGISRLPHRAVNYGMGDVGDMPLPPTDPADTARALEVWPAAQEEYPRFALIGGAEFVEEESHGHGTEYDHVPGAAYRVHMDDVHNDVAQARFVMGCNCTSGEPGGVHNQSTLTRAGGAILAVGASKTTYVDQLSTLTVTSADTAFRRALAAGMPFGRAFLSSFPFTDRYRTMFYGDLSVPTMMAPPNAVPEITSLAKSETTVYRGKPVTFTVAVSDPDAAAEDSPYAAYEHKVEWFMNGYNYGRSTPTYTTDSTQPHWTNVTHTYTTAGTRTLRAQVIDEWRAVHWKEITLNVIEGAPTAVPDGANTFLDTPVEIAVLANDSDPQGDPLGLAGVSQPAHGAVATNAGGTVTYTPAAGWTGTDTFAYWVHDGNGFTGTAAVAVWVTDRPQDLCARRMKITFAGCAPPGGGTLTNFPALVRLDEGLPGFAYAAFAFGDGRDLIFSDAAGMPLSHEIEVWNTNGTSLVWVRVPLLAATNNCVWAYWSNPTAPPPPPGSAVWVEKFVLVAHLTGLTGAATPDSTANANHGVPAGGVTLNGPGYAGGGAVFDGNDDKVTFGTANRPADTFSFGAWIKTAETHQIDGESTSGTGGTSGQNYAFEPAHGGDGAGAGLSIGTNGVSVYEHGAGYMPAPAVYSGMLGSNWNCVAVTYENKRPCIYVNGALVRTGRLSPRPVVYAPRAVGDAQYGDLNGALDEVRLAATARSAGWIWAEYMTMASNAVFTAYGPVLEQEPDRDHDGIPDNVDPDDDNDGMSDADEAIAGTDPLDPGSLFVVGGTRSESNIFGLFFGSTTGRWYDILYKEDLLDTNEWLVLETNRPGTGGPIEVPDTMDATQRFYRVRVRLF
ncbi:MAG: DUF2341 domain-containing protein [Kiritimatiellae bacterium]|nr:DUF2341 domain-containing protein [Kiritimatiellia bacterium]